MQEAGLKITMVIVEQATTEQTSMVWDHLMVEQATNTQVMGVLATLLQINIKEDEVNHILVQVNK
jgi:hypothetical protein